MIIDKQKNLSILSDRLLPDKYKGSTFEKVVKSYLSFISEQHTYVNHFTNRIDIAKIETSYSKEELDAYVAQYASILRDILNIEYPLLNKNRNFAEKYNFWGLKLQYKTDYVLYTGVEALSDNWFSFLYDSTNRFLEVKNKQALNTVHYLYQDQIFNPSQHKYEVSFDVLDLEESKMLKVYVLPDEGLCDSNEAVYTAYGTGSYRFRLDFNNSDLVNDGTSKLIFSFNGSLKITNIKVTEYDRITQDDIKILSSQIIQNKGRIALYNFLFSLLQNLGANDNIDTNMLITENEVISSNVKPRISVSEIYESSKTNIVYDSGSTYLFGRQDYYEVGHAFKEYVTTYNSDVYIPFKYKIESTFSESVFNRYILPIVHPVGWEIVYDVYKLVEMIDAVNSKNFIELDSSKYTEQLFKYTNSSGTVVWDGDVLQTPISTVNISIQQLSPYTDEYLAELLGDLVITTHSTNLGIDSIDIPLEEFSHVFLELLNLANQGTDIVLVIDSDVVTKIDFKETQTTDTLQEDLPLVYGSSAKYDFGGDEIYSDSGTVQTVNESIRIIVTPKHTFDSSNTSANIINGSIVLKLEGYGHGEDGFYYMWTGTSGTMNLVSTNFTSGSWFNLNARVPA